MANITHIDYNGATFDITDEATKNAISDNTYTKEQEIAYTDLTWIDGAYVNKGNGQTIAQEAYSYADITLPNTATKVTGYTNTAPNSIIGVAFITSDGTYLSGDGSTNTGKYDYNFDLTVPSGATTFRVSCRTAYKSSFACKITKTVDGLGKIVNEQKTIIESTHATTNDTTRVLNNYLADGKQYFDESLFINGSLVAGYIQTGSKYRVSSTEIFTAQRDYTVKAKDGFRFGVHTFVNGEYSSDSAWQTTFDIPEGTTFKIVIARVTESTSEIANVHEFVSSIYIETAISTIENALTDYIGEGNLNYVGERISIAESSQIRKCTCNLWKDFAGASITDATSYYFNTCQSLAIHGGYVFVFAAVGICTIIDYATKEIISKTNFQPSAHQHANSAQFTDIYYSASDEFPLLLLSRCGNTAGETGYDECLIYRISKNGNSFTFTLVNSITVDFASYGASWACDTNTGELYFYTPANGTWQVTENNPILFAKFAMPNINDILSGTQITLTRADILSKMYIQHVTPQGMCVNGDVIYCGITYQGQNVWAISIDRNIILAKINLGITHEVEGVAIYNGRMYVSAVDGSDTSAINPLKIFELVF